MTNLTEGQAESLDPLKAILELISSLRAQYQVRFYVLFMVLLRQLHLQATVDIKERMDILYSRITRLAELFGVPASDGVEEDRRERFLTYAIGLRLGWMLKPFQ